MREHGLAAKSRLRPLGDGFTFYQCSLSDKGEAVRQSPPILDHHKVREDGVLLECGVKR
jgi:hypothetical protein